MKKIFMLVSSLIIFNKLSAQIIGANDIDPATQTVYNFVSNNEDASQPVTWTVSQGAVIISNNPYSCTIMANNQNPGQCDITLSIGYTNYSGIYVNETKNISRSAFMTGPQTAYPGETFTYTAANPCHNPFSCTYTWTSTTGAANNSTIAAWHLNGVGVLWPTVIPATALLSGIIGHVKCSISCNLGSYSTFTADYPVSLALRPPVITGPAIVRCGAQTPLVYTASVVAGANASSTYQWVLPAGWLGSSTTNTISVTPNGTSAGNISVRVAASNAVKSVYSTFAIAFQKVTAINGSANICTGSSTTFNAVSTPAGLTGNYTWKTNTPGWLINGLASPVTTPSASVTVTAPSTAGTTTLSVITSTSCAPISLPLSSLPVATPVFRSSNKQSTCTFREVYWYIDPVANATSYTWATTSSGVTLTPGGTSCIITATGPGGKVIKVRANNQCGSSAWRVLSLAIVTHPCSPR